MSLDDLATGSPISPTPLIDDRDRLQKLADERWSTIVHIEGELRDLRIARDALANEVNALTEDLSRVKDERDEARGELVKAMQTIERAVQTIELNAPGGPCLNLCEQPSMCACCGRMRKDGRRDRRWVFVAADVSRALRFSIRVAFCAKCFDELEARAAKLRGKEQIDQPGEVRDAG